MFKAVVLGRTEEATIHYPKMQTRFNKRFLTRQAPPLEISDGRLLADSGTQVCEYHEHPPTVCFCLQNKDSYTQFKIIINVMVCKYCPIFVPCSANSRN